MNDFIKASYDGKPCLLNMDYVVDIFVEHNGKYKAYTMDFDRKNYLIEKAEFERWQAENEK